MAEDEEDDESFGDFKFASFPNQPSLENHAWGDFINHSNHINATTISSKPFDPFTLSSDPLEKRVNDTNSIVVEPNKTRGAIPLSIFGEEEEEPVSSVSNDLLFSNGSNCNGGVKTGSDLNGSVGISDLISNLYYQQPQVGSQNGSVLVSVSNVVHSNPNANDSNRDVDEDEDDGWEFKSAEWETGNKNLNDKVEVPKHGNNTVGVGALLDSSNGISDKVDEWHLGFEFSPVSASHSLQPGPKSESNETGTGFSMFNQTFGKLANAHSWPGSNQTLEAPKKDSNIYPTAIEAFNDDDGASHSTIDPSLSSQSHKSNGWGFGFDFNSSSMGEDSLFSESYFKTENNHNENGKSNASSTNINVNSDVNLFESKDAIKEIGIKHEKPLITSENHKEALPLSIFGDDMPDTNEHSVSQDLSPYAPVSPMQNNFNSPSSNLSINDLIWSLYSQTENKTSTNVTPKASENQIHVYPELSSSNFDNNDGFDDDFGDFKDASPETTDESAQNTFNHPTEVSENGLHTSLEVLNSHLVDDDDFEDDSWEFKDAVSGTSTHDQASTTDHRDLLTQLSTKLESSDCVEFFSKLKDELCNNVLFHLQNLKKAQDDAALSGEYAKVKALQVEIQESSEILRQHHMSIPVEYLSENYSPRNVDFDELLKVLKGPKFLPLESEYQIASRLSTGKTDIKSAMELLKDAVSTLRILELGSVEEQTNYLTIWSKIAFVCSQELKHGAYIWKEAVQKNVRDQLLSIPKGVQYVHALGEIYRVAEIVGASTKLYKPWTLSGSNDCTSLYALLNECNSLWLASGLEEALSRELVESIKYIRELDEHALQSYLVSGEETMCQLSALPAGCIPGLNLATWNGKPYFVKLANLWVNLISSDPPK